MSQENNKFHNPYHFVPVVPDRERTRWEACDLFFNEEEPGHWSHGRYATNEGIHHGRIICKLTTETPIFIGATRTRKGTDEAPGEVQPFELKGKPAIPATSLRGVISSVAEAASNSALRVLEDKLLSRRMEMREGLKAIGILQSNEATGRLELLPLAIPPIPCDINGEVHREVDFKWRFIFHKPGIKVYVNGYHPDEIDKPRYSHESFLEKVKPDSHSSANIEIWYMKLGKTRWENRSVVTDIPHVTKIPNSYFLSGQESVDLQNEPIPQKKYDELTKEDQAEYTPGILRILGIEGRTNDIPGKKTHEIFLPYPDSIQKNLKLDVTQALEEFHKLADQRTKTDNHLPFELKGMQREGRDKKLRLKADDIVFFDVHKVNDDYVVKEISLSSIWRKRVDGSVYDFFSFLDQDRNNHSELLPFQNGRQEISPAEMMFGFVEDRKEDGESASAQQPQPRALAYAGRVRFSHGIWQPDVENQDRYCPSTTLKILDSPKPPSPAFYFKTKSAPPGYIAKKSLKPNDHMPQGRKFYLHKYSEDCAPWETQIHSGNDPRFKQKVSITPIPAERTFWFHIDFDNLSSYELGMLLHALKPTPEFRHKIGMGKPLGLGSIDIAPVAVFQVDRRQRYREYDIFSDTPRYHRAWIANQGSWKNCPPQYDDIRVKDNDIMEEDELPMVSEFSRTINQDIEQALKLIGNPDKVGYPVHAPLRKNQAPEKDTYEWFAQNDDIKTMHKQCLKPISKGTDNLPTLDRN